MWRITLVFMILYVAPALIAAEDPPSINTPNQLGSNHSAGSLNSVQLILDGYDGDPQKALRHFAKVLEAVNARTFAQISSLEDQNKALRSDNHDLQESLSKIQAQVAQRKRKTVGVFIGVKDYEGGYKPLTNGKTSAFNTASAFSQSTHTVPFFVKSHNPTRYNLLTTIEQAGIYASKDPDIAELVIYLSGHGFMDKTGNIFFVSAQGDPIPVVQIANGLKGYDGDIHILLDACLTSKNEVIDLEPMDHPKFNLITASQPSEIAIESAEFASSFFAKGLEYALSKQNSTLNWERLFRDASQETVKTAQSKGFTQTPKFWPNYKQVQPKTKPDFSAMPNQIQFYYP